MTEIIRKVTVEKFDDEGNLVERVVTEYGFAPVPQVVPGTGLRVGDVWPYKVGDTLPYSGVTSIVTNPEKYTSWNLPADHVVDS